MPAIEGKVPFLPGIRPNRDFNIDRSKIDHRKRQSLGFKNGYILHDNTKSGQEPKSTPKEEALWQDLLTNPYLDVPAPMYDTATKSEVGRRARQYGQAKHAHNEEILGKVATEKATNHGNLSSSSKPLIPAYVAFDKIVLRFDGYFKQTIHDSEEQFLLRRVQILVFVEDDSVMVLEPPQENSGIPQGILVKRQRMPADGSFLSETHQNYGNSHAKGAPNYYTAKDFNLGINITFYGRSFRIVKCDKFTENYMTKIMGIKLNTAEEMPSDPYLETRSNLLSTEKSQSKVDKPLKKFLQNDRKVLRFYAVWDDRDRMYGEVREFVIHYFLVDDSIEVREVQKPNSGRDAVPILLKRQQLPKILNGLDWNWITPPKYTWRDMKIGTYLNVLNRHMLLTDCDAYTKRFYQEKMGYAANAKELQPLNFKAEADPEPIQMEVPPYNGFGSVEDSLRSCKSLVLNAPTSNITTSTGGNAFIKMIENEKKVLRFVACMDSTHPEDADRRFVISYMLADDSMTIYEPPQRNTGILGGKFMQRTQVLKPGHTLQNPAYYEANDLYVGACIRVLCHDFVLLDADEYVFNYMESQPEKFPKSNAPIVFSNLAAAIQDSPDVGAKWLDALYVADPTKTGSVPASVFIESGLKALRSRLSKHEIVTLARYFRENKSPEMVNYNRILAAS